MEQTKNNHSKKYILPFVGKPIIISQGYKGSYSHFLKQAGRFMIDDTYSIDFVLPLDTRVIAVRPGIVTGIVDEISAFYKGTDFNIGVKYPGNHVEIRHDDGTYAYYEHLKKGSISDFIKEGYYIKQGEIIGLVGESGWIGPRTHLHFEVYKRNNNHFLRKSFPVKFCIPKESACPVDGIKN